MHMQTRHTCRELAIFWSRMKVFGGIEQLMAMFTIMMSLMMLESLIQGQSSYNSETQKYWMH